MFINGQAAAVINGPWVLDKYKRSGVNFAVGTLPKLSNGMRIAPFFGVKGYAIAKKSKNKDLVEKFLVYASQPRYAMIRYQKSAELPPVKELLANPLIIQDEVATAMANQAANAIDMPSDPKMKDVWESMEDAFEDAIKNEKADIKAILDKAVKEIKE